MFYELYDWDTDNDEKEYHLVNLDEILQVNKTNGSYEKRNPTTGKVEKYYRFVIYYTGKGNSWTFYYRSESERHLAYEELKKAMREFRLLPHEPVNPNDVTNILEERPDIFDEILRNPGQIDVPEVKLCE